MADIETQSSVCVTRQHEYVLYASHCVAVRERSTGLWLEDHHALEERVALVPTVQKAEGLGLWDLVVHTFGFQIQIGPIVAVEKPDDETLQRIATAPRLPAFALAETLSFT